MNTFDSILALLDIAHDYRDNNVGLEEEEIHALAYLLRNETEKLFSDISFSYKNAHLTSPEISRKLSFFTPKNTTTFGPYSNVPRPGQYYHVKTKLSSLDSQSQKYREELTNEEIDTIKQEVETLIQNPSEYIQKSEEELQSNK